jgi:hypothetical protein
VLDSAFEPFVRMNKNILPNWFIQAIQSDLNTPIGHAAFNTAQVFTTSKENHNEVAVQKKMKSHFTFQSGQINQGL